MALGILMSVCWSLHHLGPYWNVLTITGWNAVKQAGTDINGAQITNPTDLVIRWLLAPPADQGFHSSCEISEHLAQNGVQT